MRREMLGYVLAAVITTSAAFAQAPPSSPREKPITPPVQTQQSPKSPDQSQSSGKPNQQSSPPIPPHVDVTVSGNVSISSPSQAQQGNNKHDEGFYNVKVTDVVIAIFTALLVAGTFLLWDATRRLWRAADKELVELRTSITDNRAAAERQAADMQQSITASQASAAAATAQAEAMRNMFVSTHRPHIRFKHIWLTSELWKAQPIIVDLNVVNVGSTTATLHKCNFSTVIVSDGGRLPQRPPYYGTGFCSMDRDCQAA